MSSSARLPTFPNSDRVRPCVPCVPWFLDRRLALLLYHLTDFNSSMVLV